VVEQPFLFTPPVLLHEDAVRELCRLARRGYETMQKQEAYGFLFGRLGSDGRLMVRHARAYRGGRRTRWGVEYPVYGARRRSRELATRLRLRYLGSFHSHVEIAGRVSRGMSADDRRTFREDDRASIEAVVFVWAGPRRTLRPSPRSVVGYEPDTDYHYRIRVYRKVGGGVRRVRVKVKRTGVVVVY